MKLSFSLFYDKISDERLFTDYIYNQNISSTKNKKLDKFICCGSYEFVGKPGISLD